MAWIRLIAKWFNPRRRLIALAMVGWILLVIVGAGRAPNAEDWVSVPDLGALVVLGAALAAIVGIVLLLVLRPTTKAARGPAQRRPRRLPVIAILVFVMLLIAFAPKQDDEAPPPPDTQPPVASEADPAATQLGDDGDGVRRNDVLALILMGALAAGVLLYTARRETPTDAANAALDGAGDLAAAIWPAIDIAAQRLRGDGEPRAAVIAAYAGLERALAQRGHPRRSAETPSEHMARALAAIPAVADPATRLGALYELARFSDHPISEADRRRAAAALDEARGSLETMADHAR